MTWLVLVLIFGLLALIPGSFCRGLNEEFTWTRISYAASIRLAESYIYENNIPMSANRWRNKLFVTVPRRRPGIPSTLNFIWTNTSQKHNVPLISYPNFAINQLPTGDSDGFVSIYRTAVDPCNRLWMVDTGTLEYPGNVNRLQQPAVVIIDLLTDQIIRRYELRPLDITNRTSLATMVVDVTPATCNSAYAYMPDLSGFGVVVYSFQENRSWRVSHNYFSPDAQAKDFTIGNVNFQLNDGIFSLSLSDVKPDGHRNAYFHSLAGTHTYSVSTHILKNRRLATRMDHGNDFMVEVNRGQQTQASASDLHRTSGILFLGLVNQNALACWNSFTPATPDNFDIIYKDDQKFQYPCDVKISGDDVIVITNAMPVFLFGKLNYNEINFRIWIRNVYEAIRDTKCAMRPF
ncbi:hypothetical protein PPYR_04736 [Photinus pyralis]|uniref:Bee-milk protein n=1 Tax=Photinus pyralis TaxID=7054 RepID=A0A5N4AZG7_PHOPY|nr:L-dopachrome tautomerase yellow-f2-like isoform X1 [Photinus pyralis]KAB0802550.1 hypothetical protein PPYR_04736 [Photinus pyralis]